jgi:hypothetical protein
MRVRMNEEAVSVAVKRMKTITRRWRTAPDLWRVVVKRKERALVDNMKEQYPWAGVERGRGRPPLHRTRVPLKDIHSFTLREEIPMGFSYMMAMRTSWAREAAEEETARYLEMLAGGVMRKATRGLLAAWQRLTLWRRR